MRTIAIKPVKAELGYFGVTNFFPNLTVNHINIILLLQAHIIASCPWADPEEVKGGDGNSSNRFGQGKSEYN